MASTTFPPDDLETPTVADDPESRPGGIPLYVWVIAAAVLAVPVGHLWGPGASALDIIPALVIRALKALATPLVVLAILSAIVTNEVRGRQGLRMILYYLMNTIVAITIGLVLANVVQPGVGAELKKVVAGESKAAAGKGIGQIVDELIPDSIGDSFVRNNLAQLVIVTLALGIGLAKIRDEQNAAGQTSYHALVDVITVGFELLMRVLLWIVALVPLAVFGVVASNIGREGLGVFKSLGWFIAVVLIGLACQIVWYLTQLAVFARMSPARFLRGARDVMATSFSTASTGATMPFTLKALMGPLGVSRGSSQLAACVGTNFNNDGTALYQAAVVLFMAQSMGRSLSLSEQLIVVVTTVLASIGAGCIPSGGFVTLPLIFAAVGLPAENLPIILTVDWFLDRCRTSSNVLGDMTVAVLLDQTADDPGQTEPAIAA
ncbi:dicarboxylate/amino acid:cation symporter [Isosphaeraceae bacterium EP7]